MSERPPPLAVLVSSLIGEHKIFYYTSRKLLTSSENRSPTFHPPTKSKHFLNSTALRSTRGTRNAGPYSPLVTARKRANRSTYIQLIPNTHSLKHSKSTNQSSYPLKLTNPSSKASSTPPLSISGSQSTSSESGSGGTAATSRIP